MIQSYLPLAQAIIAALLIVLILIQQRGTALGSAFGGTGGSYGTMRGIQKKIFLATIVCGTLFIIIAVLNLAL